MTLHRVAMTWIRWGAGLMLAGTIVSAEAQRQFDLTSDGIGPYEAGRGFGFEPGFGRSGDAPYLFSVKVPEGNYRITVTLGDPTGESNTTIKAEQRRLMLENVSTALGEIVTRRFVVNVRTPKIASGGEVKLKERERTTETLQWDDKLTLEINGTRPRLRSVEIEPTTVPTVFLLGDSTVCDQPGEAYASWGQMLTRFFGPSVAVSNHAESGESLRSSLHARRLDKVVETMQPGDWLLIQYGHNDMKEKGEGVGAFTSYAADLTKFVAAAREKGGRPVLITSVHRRTFNAEGKIVNSFGDYPEAVRRVAREENVPLIDLNAMSTTLYETLGPEGAKRLFNDPDATHHCNYGAYELAECVVSGIRATVPELAKHLAIDAARFDPAHPDPIATFDVPPSPVRSEAKPAGN
jgi:lysophospholipase L1-like esterase